VDNQGGVDASPATATVTVTAVDDGTPVAVNESFNAVVSTPIIISKATLLANDSLPDNAAFVSFTAPTTGTLVDNGNGTLTYTPTGAAGTPTFTYTIQDDQGQTSVATVTMNVLAAGTDLATVYESALPAGNGGGTTVATGNLFTNDGGVNTSISRMNFNGGAWVTDGSGSDTDSRTGYIGVTTARGELVVDITGAGAGDFTYTLNAAASNTAPADNASLTETFNYDANAADSALKLTIMDDAPTATNITVDVAESSVPKFSIVLTVDISGSMLDDVRSIAADGTVTITTRMEMAKTALAALVEEYYTQSPDVQFKIVQFDDVADILNSNNWYSSKGRRIDGDQWPDRQRWNRLRRCTEQDQVRDGGLAGFQPAEHRLLPFGREPDRRQYGQSSRRDRLRHLYRCQQHQVIRGCRGHGYYQPDPHEWHPQRRREQ
jgi:hypothetical protein